MAAVDTDSTGAGEQIKAILRRCRGRPRLTDADRAQRRLESRKKYDVRRVYLGEAHQVWSELRRRTSLSDAGLAEYLILLNSAYGEKYQQKYAKYAFGFNDWPLNVLCDHASFQLVVLRQSISAGCPVNTHI